MSAITRQRHMHEGQVTQADYGVLKPIFDNLTRVDDALQNALRSARAKGQTNVVAVLERVVAQNDATVEMFRDVWKV